jgi:hypothetical protein
MYSRANLLYSWKAVQLAHKEPLNCESLSSPTLSFCIKKLETCHTQSAHRDLRTVNR